MSTLKAPFLDTSGVVKAIYKIGKAYNEVGNVYDLTMKDMISRAPGKIASAVTWMYGIKKSEVLYKRKGPKSTGAGSISVRGGELATLEFHYKGRLLTPLHFGMTPKERPAGKKKYKIKAKIKKRLKAFPSRPETSTNGGTFLAPVKKGRDKQIPWFRYSEDKFDIQPIKTVSLPQMVDNKLVRRKINTEIGDLMQKRFDHHLAKFIKKNL